MSKVLVDREVVAQVVEAAFSAYCSQRLGELVPTLRAALEQDPALLQEPVAVIGSCFQLLWARRKDWSKGLEVGDALYAAPQPAQPARQAEADRLLAQALDALVNIQAKSASTSSWVKCWEAMAAIRKHLSAE